MALELYDYQKEFYKKIAAAASKNKSVCAQLETGGGKTCLFATIAYNYLQTTKKDVIIFVDSQSIFDQTRRTLFEWYGIDSDTINAESCTIKRNTLFGTNRVFLAMVETFDRRSARDSFLQQIREVGLVIIDECHMKSFIKIFDHFIFSLRIGFSATPIYTNNKRHISKDYGVIVCGPTTSDLIELGAVVEDATYSVKGNVNRDDFSADGEDYNQDVVGSYLSGSGGRHIQNTVDAYVKHALGKKMLCFNANVKHSKMVCQAFCDAGFPAMHLDSNMSNEQKKELLGDAQRGKKGWLNQTPGAILCNVGMTTKGFDEKSIEGVILNTLTKSITKYRQMVGRGARKFEGKKYNIVLDLCDNVLGGGHGRWSDNINWEFLFNNPKIPRKGVAPSKQCPECDYINAASARICKGMIMSPFDEQVPCGYEFPKHEYEDDSKECELVLISKNIDIDKIINFPSFFGKADWVTFRETVRACAYYTRKEVKHDLIERDEFEDMWTNLVRPKITEWQVKKGAQKEKGNKIRDTKWYNEKGRFYFLDFLREYGFVVQLDEVENLQESQAYLDN